jgi:hypothetical protein
MFEPLFIAARVISAIYRILSTTLLLFYIIKRMIDGRKATRISRRARNLYDRTWDSQCP